mgnify:CR=1 FL=1
MEKNEHVRLPKEVLAVRQQAVKQDRKLLYANGRLIEWITNHLLASVILFDIAFVVPLVLATGAGASARKSIGITVFSGMLASTCLAVLFVPAFFVVVQRFENWRAGRKEERMPDASAKRVTAPPPAS